MLITRLRARRVAGLCLAAFCAAGLWGMPAYADRERLSFSTVEWDAQRQSLDVIHRIHIHDAQQALVREGLLDEPDLIPIKNRARLALYAGSQFRLAGPQADIDLDLLGAEIDGNYIYVYQQAEMKTAPKTLYVDCQILRGVFPDQSNHVNVTLEGAVLTLTFTSGDGIKSAP